MMTQDLAPAPKVDPLTDRDRQIIATIVNQSDYPHECQPDDVITIWINSDDIVWVEMIHGYARFHKEAFKSAVAEIKVSLSTPLSPNQQSDVELEQACIQVNLSVDFIDWLSFSTGLQANKLIGYAGCYLQKPQLLTVPADWNFAPPKFASPPAAICPDCDGHGCCSCSYRGTRAEDLCTPVDDYRLTYVGRTDIQTAHNVYKDDKFVGILFKVRNPDEVWENTPQTYYWRCGNGVKYWSVREAIEVLQRGTAVVNSEAPAVSRELVAA
ncbi:hypothetical protein A6770_28810 [Nostoc minutum NIES-26]|uniref:Uncharacterized protein n=1 Tax=Nostoc minutum NIES-26 TaxID=1844469 RepID=A0A367QJZ1_9NOSO|nr:hypothetical protein A6770_28810 [Nostoc minutum NIES-26]